MFTDVLRTMPWSTLSLKLEKGVAGEGKWMQEGTTDGICTRDANPCGECRQKSCDGKKILKHYSKGNARGKQKKKT